MAQLVIGQGSIWIGLGLGAGLLLAFASQRLIQSFLYHVRPLDAWTYLSVLLLLPLIGLIAAFLPARKAASIQPMQALREDQAGTCRDALRALQLAGYAARGNS